MTENNIKHFETLWDESEALVSKIHEKSSHDDLIKLISNLTNDYKEMHSSNLPDEVKSSLKTRYMGEIIFLLSALSQRDNINVYAALKEELFLNSYN